MTEINHYACDQRIAQLEAENAKLRAALKKFIEADETDDTIHASYLEGEALSLAQAALAKIKEES